MAEPIGPEAYLAIAACMSNAVGKFRDKKRVEQDKKVAIISADSSKSSLTLAADELLLHSGLKVGNDGYVQWAADTPAHPRNWSRARKAYDLGLILFLEFVASAVGAAGTPASFYALRDLGHGREVGLVGFTAMYLLGQGLGALLLSPYSDKLGRRTLYIASAFLYSVFCLPVAATSNIAGVFVGRLITGVISAIPAITTLGSIDDLCSTEGRLWAFFSWALVANLGLVVGPIYASYVAVSLNWRWIFYLATIIVAVTGMMMGFVRESHTPQLLERKVAAIQSHRADLILRTAPAVPHSSIFRPLGLLFTRPIVMLSAVTMAFTTALLYLFAVAFPIIYAHYAWNRQKTTLIFLFIALGLFLSTLTRFRDRHVARKFRLANRSLNPEKGLFGLAIGAPVLAVGLWWFAWTTPGANAKNVAWPASATSLILLGYAVNEHSTTLPRYVIASHKSKTDAASAFVALLFTRALFGATFPLFTRPMFNHLGNGPAGSILATVATALCTVPVILITYGATRGKSSASVAKAADAAEKAAAKKAKPKKTVRWGDETDDASSSSSETKGDESRCAALSDLSQTESDDDFESDPDVRASVAAMLEVERRKDFADCGGREPQRPDTSASASDSGSEYSELSLERLHTRRSRSNSDPTFASPQRQSHSSSAGGADDARRDKAAEVEEEDESKRKKQKQKEKRKAVEATRVDDGDDGALGFLGLGPDLERVAGLPWF